MVKEQLFEKANRIMEKITSVKNMSQKLVNERDEGVNLDKKEILNIAITTKKLLSQLKDVLTILTTAKDLTSEEKENVEDAMEETVKALTSLDMSIKEVENKID